MKRSDVKLRRISNVHNWRRYAVVPKPGARGTLGFGWVWGPLLLGRWAWRAKRVTGRDEERGVAATRAGAIEAVLRRAGS